MNGITFSGLVTFAQSVLLLLAWVFFPGAAEGARAGDDLEPVEQHEQPEHGPVPIVAGGEVSATIAVMGSGGQAREIAVNELKSSLFEATGAELKVVRNEIPNSPAIVLGDCEAAAAHGLKSDAMEPEAFHIKTAPDRVFIVGKGKGTTWGVFAFLERFVGVRWYWPSNRGGRSVPERDGLALEPTWISDAPVFRMRTAFPPRASSPYDNQTQHLQRFRTRLREGDSWPMSLVVHGDSALSKAEEYREQKQMWQLTKEGEREYTHPCYTAPETVEAFLSEIERYENGKEPRIGIKGDTVTVSPADVGINCHSDKCRTLWQPDAGQYGRASKIMAMFVKRLGERVQKRFPGKRILFLPYQNYTIPPEDVDLPENVYVQMCHMPGVALYKEPMIRDRWQGYIDGWVELTGHPIQDWHYSIWPADRTDAPYQYPHTVNDYYRRNREKTVGSFINGGGNHWPRFHISLYVWMKSLWDPEIDVDAVIESYTQRMYGDAAETVHKLVQLQIQGWEESRWGDGFSPRTLYEEGYPKETLERMRALLEKAREQVKGDAQASKRLAYFTLPFDRFFKEYETVIEGKGKPRVVLQKVNENPTVDGRLDEDAWGSAPATDLVTRRNETEVEPTHATSVKGVYTLDGFTVGLRMVEPAPEKLYAQNGSTDNGTLWHNDCVELFFDTTEHDASDFYQFIVTAGLDMFHARGGDTAWDPNDVRAAKHVGDDYWSLEIFVPLSALEGVDRLGSTEWRGQITRHRWGRNKPGPDENQRLNFESGKHNSSRSDFCRIQFRE